MLKYAWFGTSLAAVSTNAVFKSEILEFYQNCNNSLLMVFSNFLKIFQYDSLILAGMVRWSLAGPDSGED